MAQTTPASPASKPMAPAAAPAPTGKPAMGAKSAECSKLADAKGLHGKARRHFRSACKRGKTQG
jgi:psiF repeat